PKPAGLPPPQRPKKVNEEETWTWLSTRYPPSTERPTPSRNVPTPPGVPPAPRRPRMSAFASSRDASSCACFESMVGMIGLYPEEPSGRRVAQRIGICSETSETSETDGTRLGAM